MRHIRLNQITTIAADYEDGNFPVENLLDSRPKRKWSAGGMVKNATLTVEMAGGCSDLAIFGTNARTVSATAEDPCAVTFHDSDAIEGGYVLKNTTISTTATTTVDENGDALWVQFSPAIGVPCVVDINLTASGADTLYAGVIAGGTAETYGGANFRYGAGVNLDDKSIVAQNSNGSRYYKKRSICRQVQLTALMLRTEADKLESAIRSDGAISSAWMLFSNVTATDMLFGWPQFSRTYDNLLHDNINLTLTEEI